MNLEDLPQISLNIACSESVLGTEIDRSRWGRTQRNCIRSREICVFGETATLLQLLFRPPGVTCQVHDWKLDRDELERCSLELSNQLDDHI
jgi:hypothetical protein